MIRHRLHATGSLSGPRPDSLGQSEAFLAFQERLARVAPVNRPVLLVGERGTGKELAANRLHFLSQNWQAPLVTLHCAALSPSLIEAELFGHERGAFTGAVGTRAGRFEAAHGGTLFLDEIGLIPLEVQEKILRVVEYGRFEPVGSSSSVEVDVRIVAATNADLPGLARKGCFKQDLLDRLSFEVLFLPPLRVRTGDIMLLAGHFAGRIAHELGRENMPSFSAAAAAALEGYPWPGNIRELKNVVERAVYRCDDDIIGRIVFDPFASPYPPLPQEGGEEPSADRPPPRIAPQPLKEAVAALEQDMVREALERSRHNQRKAARLLGLSYDQFRGLRRKHARFLDSDR